MNYLSLKANFTLKLEGKCWKDDVVTFTAHLNVTIKRLYKNRYKNSPYFFVFKYARATKQKVWNEAENRERDREERSCEQNFDSSTTFLNPLVRTNSLYGKRTVGFFLSPYTPYGRVKLARFARVRLLRHALPISLLILRKKPTVLQSIRKT